MVEVHTFLWTFLVNSYKLLLIKMSYKAFKALFLYYVSLQGTLQLLENFAFDLYISHILTLR